MTYCGLLPRTYSQATYWSVDLNVISALGLIFFLLWREDNNVGKQGRADNIPANANEQRRKCLMNHQHISFLKSKSFQMSHQV